MLDTAMPTLSDRIAGLLQEIRPEADFRAELDFIEAGLLDSFDMITLVDALDRHFAIAIDGLDIVPHHFSSLAAITRLLGKYGVA